MTRSLRLERVAAGVTERRYLARPLLAEARPQTERKCEILRHVIVCKTTGSLGQLNPGLPLEQRGGIVFDQSWLEGV